MRISRLLIENSGPLKNLDVVFRPVTLIVGDNERGKTCFLNWVSRCVFEKPGKNSFGESWTNTLNKSANVRSVVQPMYENFDSGRMKNLLFIKDSDFYLKTENRDEISLDEFWNNEIRALLYGQDNISDELQHSFMRAMGVGSSARTDWLARLHANIFELKAKVEEFVPDVEGINSKYSHLQQLNDSIGQLDQTSHQINDKEEVFFLADKIVLGRKYLDGIDKYYGLRDEKDRFLSAEQQYKNSLESLKQKENLMFDYEDKIGDLKIELSHLSEENEMIQNNPSAAYTASAGGNFLRFVLGTVALGFGLFLAYRTRTAPFNIVKLVALISFLYGTIALASAWFRSSAIRFSAAGEGYISTLFRDYLVARSQKSFLKKSHELDRIQNEYQLLHNECKQLRRVIKTQKYHVPSVAEENGKHDFIAYLEDLSDQVYQHFSTDDPEVIQREIAKLEARINAYNPDFDFSNLQELKQKKIQLMQEQNLAAQDYSKVRSNILRQIKSLLDDLKSQTDKNMVSRFYPELDQLEIKNDLESYHEFTDQLQALSDTLSRDVYYAERLVDIYQHIEKGADTFIHRVLQSSFFTHLIQNIFGGKYASFSSETDAHKKIRIYAHTGTGNTYSLEQLSASSCAQFWFVLRLVFAYTVLEDEPGIIVLDDPFSTFDTLRKQSLIEILNAFVHKGWQVVCSLTDDPTVYGLFKDYFGETMEVVDLNKEDF